MKKTTFSIFTFCFAIAGAAIAEPKKPDSPASKGKKGAGKGGEFFQRMDKNQDRAISKEEAGKLWDRIGRLDKDSDGKVSGQEFLGARQQGGGGSKPAGGFDFSRLFQHADKNKDEKLTKEEIPRMWEQLSKKDANNDGALDKKELAAGASAKPGGKGSAMKPGEMFSKGDRNGDGKISKDEVPEQAWERLGKADANKDGAVSKQEMETAMKMVQAAKGGMMGRGGSGYGQGGGVEAMFGKMDADKDGKLSKSEVPAEMWAKLSRADEDADGTVSKAEMEKVYAERAKSGYGGSSKMKPEGSSKKSDTGSIKPKRPALES